MFNLFLFNCCQNPVDNDFDFNLDISHNESTASSLEEEINNLKLSLKDKLCLFTIHSKTRELFPFNELKNDDELENILSNKYFEIYKKPNNLLSQTFIKQFSLPNYCVITMILGLDNKNEKNSKSNEVNDIKLIDCLKDREVTRHNIKKLIKMYQYVMYKPPPEPNTKDPNCCNINFRFVDEKLSFSRRYDKNTKIEELYFLISSKYPEMTFRLFRISPSTELTELKNSLEQENLYPSGIIQVIS